MRLAHFPSRSTGRRRDEGAILPMIMALTVSMGAVVVALASYVTADLRYGNVVEQRADRLAAADGGLRFGIEKLRNFQTLCTTRAGTGGGFTTVFPPEINGATTEVTCRRVGAAISDVQGWGVVVTGAGVPAGQDIFLTKGAGGSNNVKTFSGPVYVADPTRIDLAAILEMENGDLWYTRSDCDVPVSIPEVTSGYLRFVPDFFRGPLCTELQWNTGLFSPPTVVTPPAGILTTVNPAPITTDPNCKVFLPGKYTTAPALDANNYFRAGDYYFDDVTIELQNKTLIAGFPDGAGDQPKVENTACNVAQQTDKATVKAAGGRGGATFFMGGDSNVWVRNGGEFEIFRRKQNETFTSIVAIRTDGTNYVKSDLDFNDYLIETNSGSNNDVAIHGLVWAPYAAVSLGNVTNAANGQMLGGIVIALLDTQASASATAFSIGIETNPVDAKLLIISTATKNGRSTSIRAVVQYRPDSSELAVNSWRVSG